ncbi:uncharacterized protein EV422DRAFT_536505 [Fimicolochytrium jonesii]|uniref:uncharacterized protein n=1 Tax=Fimicolochytrium jonesii TaxID=1396493 RepID=UPI0022FE1659|nr:uncharacterized protein EV422DRAFT_536505 [Fimicolochytrium jonesii]KAI8818688.1 hypothetical protein EV422DRAFT_536505 [Fimicolochytrium jonesii]
MPLTYLRINITAQRAGSLPGYDGDRRVEWSIGEDAGSIAEAQRRTRDALRVLRAFWEESAPDGLRFKQFANTVLADGNGDSSWQTTADSPETSEISATETKVVEADLVDPLAEKLVRNPNVLPAFLSDLRDWDSFRLLLRRHGGDVPFLADTSSGASPVGQEGDASGSSNGQVTVRSGESTGSPRDVNKSDALDAAKVMIGALASRETLWQQERSSLQAALWAAGEQVRTLVTTLTETLQKVGSLPTQEAGTSSPPKSVRWDELVLKREVIRESAAQWGFDYEDGNALEWKEAEWLKELAKQDVQMKAKGEGSSTAANFSFSPEDILAVVRATRRLAGRSVGSTPPVNGRRASLSEDEDTEEDTEDEFEDPTDDSNSNEDLGDGDASTVPLKDPTADEERDGAELESLSSPKDEVEDVPDPIHRHTTPLTRAAPENAAAKASAALYNLRPMPNDAAASEQSSESPSPKVNNASPRFALDGTTNGVKVALDDTVTLIASGRRNRPRPQPRVEPTTSSSPSLLNDSSKAVDVDAPATTTKKDAASETSIPAVKDGLEVTPPSTPPNRGKPVQTDDKAAKQPVDEPATPTTPEPTKPSVPVQESTELAPDGSSVATPVTSTPATPAAPPPAQTNGATPQATPAGSDVATPIGRKGSLTGIVADAIEAEIEKQAGHSSNSGIKYKPSVENIPEAGSPAKAEPAKRKGSIVKRVWRKVSLEFKKK